jgi:hypothetical protein
MEDKNDLMKLPFRPLMVTILALVVIQVLLLVPIYGLQRGTTLGDPGLNARFSIAAIAIPVWTLGATLVQLVMLVMPASWSRHFGRDGVVDPFGWIVLGLIVVFAYGDATGIAGSLEALALIPETQDGRWFVIGSLYLGIVGIIFAAWVIERFGLGQGFWIVLAALAVFDLATGAVQAVSRIRVEGHLDALEPLAFAMAIIAVTIVLTLLVLRNGGRFEFVAWPLLLLSLLEMQSHRKQMPEILNLFIPLSIILILMLSFALLRRSGLFRLLLPITVVLAALAVLELWLIAMHHRETLPMPTSMLVSSSAVFTALWHDWRQRSANQDRG